MLADKKVYVGKFGKEVIEKAERLGFKRGTDDLEKMPFLIFIGGFNTIRSMFYVDSFNQHPFREVTPEWILNLPEVGKTWGELTNYDVIVGFNVDCDIMNIEGVMIEKGDVNEVFFTNLLPTKNEACAVRILPTLLWWRDKYNDGWKPDRSDKDYFSIGVDCLGNIDVRTNVRSVFTFNTKETLDRFRNDFKDELEIVKPLL